MKTLYTPILIENQKLTNDLNSLNPLILNYKNNKNKNLIPEIYNPYSNISLIDDLLITKTNNYLNKKIDYFSNSNVINTISNIKSSFDNLPIHNMYNKIVNKSIGKKCTNGNTCKGKSIKNIGENKTRFRKDEYQSKDIINIPLFGKINKNIIKSNKFEIQI